MRARPTRAAKSKARARTATCSCRQSSTRALNPRADTRPANLEFQDKEDASELTDADRENQDDGRTTHKKWEEDVAKGQETADELSARFAPWYYVISAESFDKIHLTRDDSGQSEGVDGLKRLTPFGHPASCDADLTRPSFRRAIREETIG